MTNGKQYHHVTLYRISQNYEPKIAENKVKINELSNLNNTSIINIQFSKIVHSFFKQFENN